MNNFILGISAYYHDSAACLLKNGVVIAAAHEERFTRIKHDSSFPHQAIEFCMNHAGIEINDVQYIVYYEKPIKKFTRILDESILFAPSGFNRFQKAIKAWLGSKLWISSNIKKTLKYKGKIYFTEHHQSHAASSFYNSPYQNATIVTMDGVGEEETVLIAQGEDNRITPVKSLFYPNSPGLFYSAFTQYCGFKVNSGEYKLMGLAPYGKPIFVDLIKKHLIKLSEDGSFIIDQTFFNYRSGSHMINSKFKDLFGHAERIPETPVSDFYKNVAASAQYVMEEMVVNIVKHAIHITGNKKVCLAGGVALNCVANSKILESVTNEVFIYPASGDAGGCVGAAFSMWYDHLNNKRQVVDPNLDNTVYLGPSFIEAEVEKSLQDNSLKYKRLSDKILTDQVAQYLIDKLVVGWFQGRAEFGPRALGNRSILASPTTNDMQQYVNLKIKKREGFRPFAPIVIEEEASVYFDLKHDSKFMLSTSSAKKRDDYPSCVHVDGSSRVQVLSKKDNSKLHDLLLAFKAINGAPVLINTSFNLRGEPMVNSPQDALNSFFNCDMDVLVIGNFIITKEANINQFESWKKFDHDLD